MNRGRDWGVGKGKNEFKTRSHLVTDLCVLLVIPSLGNETGIGRHSGVLFSAP